MKSRIGQLRQIATLLAMLAVATVAGIHAVEAGQDAWFRATGEVTTSTTSTELTKTLLDFTDDDTAIRLNDGDNDIYFGEDTDRIHFLEGDDKVNMGSGNDFWCMSYGNDALPFWGGAGIISFDAATYGDWFDRTTDYKDYIYCNTPESGAQGEDDFDSEMEIRSDEVTIRANQGDVIIDL